LKRHKNNVESSQQIFKNFGKSLFGFQLKANFNFVEQACYKTILFKLKWLLPKNVKNFRNLEYNQQQQPT